MKVRVFGNGLIPERFWDVVEEDCPVWNYPIGVKLAEDGFLKELSETEAERFINGEGPKCLGDILDKFNGENHV